MRVIIGTSRMDNLAVATTPDDDGKSDWDSIDGDWNMWTSRTVAEAREFAYHILAEIERAREHGESYIVNGEDELELREEFQ